MSGNGSDNRDIRAAGEQHYSNSVWFRPPEEPARRTRKGAPPLSRDLLAEAAVKLLDREGAARFSMRALAAELGVSPMSAYWYVENKDQLIELALDRVFGEVEVPAAEDGPGPGWRHRATSLALGLRASMLRHPWAAPLYGSHLSIGPSAISVNASMTEIFASAGLDGTDLQMALGTVIQYVFGTALSESQWHQKFQQGEDENEFYRGILDGLAKSGKWPESVPVPPPDFDIRAHRDGMFAFGLGTILDGLEARAANASGPAATERPDRTSA
ncbi:hypothetical protein BIV57_09415 [Mangrovactinospora gilvigrisea]|uniref:HTH tetR-type domain-containing protein n=1 Tax=Mangrovactinospora gilvigrisea TaxID=1428644 RepID=A0A1J7CDN9_9ACTN|nr:TetR/AcrR family transcriptional regulator C-terminal domain-containing protein [Mangrovactinospora gilvigrisea]OIV37778.1 hypothetical protein BIV57_09415 [Mangrovactinospora gilvigrisea]